jgi:hypothetical protein
MPFLNSSSSPGSTIETLKTVGDFNGKKIRIIESRKIQKKLV